MRRAKVIAVLFAVAAAVVPASFVAGPAVPPAAAAGPTFTQAWTQPIAPGTAVSTSSPVLVQNGSSPFVAAADSAGNVRAYSLSNGALVGGWGGVNVGFGVRAPLSSDGTNVYVPVAQDGDARYPRYLKLGPSGNVVWNSNPSTVLPANNTYGFLLSGLSLGRVGGAWQGAAGSSGQWIHGVDGTTGAERWRVLNADSTMATPATADLYGTGTPVVVASTDTSPEFAGDRAGGLLRILTQDGRQICSATQFVDGLTYAASGYNNSSPAIAEIGGRPLIVFGSTGLVQSGAGGNQLVAYDADCQLRWSSPPLVDQLQASPSFADLNGDGFPEVIAVVGVHFGSGMYPRVYVFNGSNGAIVGDTGTSLLSYGGAIAYPPSVSITTADVNGDGKQDLIVPAWQGKFPVLDGANLSVMTTINTNLVVQNAPIVTATSNGVRVTFAGYNGLGAFVSSYTTTSGTPGAHGWQHFGSDPQLDGVYGSLSGPYDQLLEGGSLASGASLRRGSARATMQTDGNFVVYDSAGRLRWQSNTHQAGSTLVLNPDGGLWVRSPGGTALWASFVGAPAVERLTLSEDGVLRVVSENPVATRQLNVQRTIWSSTGGRTPTDRLLAGDRLMAGQFLISSNGRGRVDMGADGNLVTTIPGLVTYQSGTRDPTGRSVLGFGADGNLVIYDNRGRPMLNYATGGRGGTQLVIGDDGVLRIVTDANGLVWSSDMPGVPRVK